MNRKIASILLLSLFLANTVNAGIFFNRNKKPDQENKGSGIQLNFGGNGGIFDGGDDRKTKAGDKSKNQGFSEYKRWSVGLMMNVYAVPFQDGNQSSGLNGTSAIIEHNMSEFFNIGATFIDQKFAHLDPKYSDEAISHKHLAVYAGMRRWVTNSVVAHVNAGITESKVEYLGESFKGTGEFMSVGLDYAFDSSDSSRIGYKYMSIAGKDKSSTRNIGLSVHGLVFRVNF